MNDISGYKWKRMKDKDIPRIENMLRDLEETCVTACTRFLVMVKPRDKLWMCFAKKKEPLAVIINSRTTLMPILCGLKEIPQFKIIKKLFQKKRIHSVQGITDDVLVLEKELKNIGVKSIDIFDFDLMSLDYLPLEPKSFCKLPNLVMCKPSLDDIEELLPLREGYEIEEVLPKGSVFHTDAAKVVLANFIKYGKILVAKHNGKIVGKIAVNGISFTKYQIGGVFVLPEYRGRGIAGAMTREFVNSLLRDGKGISLFVKKNNIPAKRLYASLGFKYKGDYRIAYY